MMFSVTLLKAGVTCIGRPASIAGDGLVHHIVFEVVWLPARKVPHRGARNAIEHPPQPHSSVDCCRKFQRELVGDRALMPQRCRDLDVLSHRPDAWRDQVVKGVSWRVRDPGSRADEIVTAVWPAMTCSSRITGPRKTGAVRPANWA